MISQTDALALAVLAQTECASRVGVQFLTISKLGEEVLERSGVTRAFQNFRASEYRLIPERRQK